MYRADRGRWFASIYICALALFPSLVVAVAQVSEDRPAVATEGVPSDDDWNQLDWERVSHDQYVDWFSAEVQRGWRHLDRLWPGADYSRIEVWVTDGRSVWIVSLGRPVSRQPFEMFAERIRYEGRFSAFGKVQGADRETWWVEVPADYFQSENTRREYRGLSQSTYIFALLSHEIFHAKVQPDWRVDGADVDRSARYPVDVEARRLRLNLIHQLRQAILQPDRRQLHLARAAGWYSQWKQESPEEQRSLHYTDVIEGTAQYFDEAVSVRAHAGVDADRQRINAAYRSLIAHDYPIGANHSVTPDSESYQLGAMAGILLEQIGNRDWPRQASNGVSPAEILLLGRQPEVTESAAEVERLLDVGIRPNAEIARKSIEPLLQRLRDPATRLLAFSALPDLKRFRSGGSYRVDEFPDVKLLIAQAAYYAIGDADIEVHNGELLMGDWVTPCGMDVNIISMLLPLPEAVQLRDGQLDYRDETIALTKVPISRQVTDGAGRVILCGPSIFDARP